MVLYVILGVVFVALLVLIWWVSTSNFFKRTEVKIKEAESGIDVALEKRYDVLTKMIDTVKSFKAHETETLENVIKLRSGMTLGEKAAVCDGMDALTGKIRLVAEAYPELRSSENYKQLQYAIADVEEHLQAARRAYNSNVTIFNQKRVSFPASIIGGKYAEKKFFEASEEKRKDVRIEI